jgi:hypothetical protein
VEAFILMLRLVVLKWYEMRIEMVNTQLRLSMCYYKTMIHFCLSCDLSYLTVPHHSTTQHFTALCTIQYCTALHCTSSCRSHNVPLLSSIVPLLGLLPSTTSRQITPHHTLSHPMALWQASHCSVLCCQPRHTTHATSHHPTTPHPTPQHIVD